MTPKMHAIERGNDELAFWLRHEHSGSEEVEIATSLAWNECPACHKDMRPIDSFRRYEKADFRELLEHYTTYHYDLLSKFHTEHENLIYAMLQGLVVITKRHGGGIQGKYATSNATQNEAIYNFMKDFGLSAKFLAHILGKSQDWVVRRYWIHIQQLGEKRATWMNKVFEEANARL
jgi:hypothetical protein